MSVMGYRAWPETLNARLRLPPTRALRAVDLFSGGGGLSLGFAASGFDVVGFEADESAVATYQSNLGHAVAGMLDEHTDLPVCDVLLAGPPCQPWSRAGSQLGNADPREGLRIVSSAIRRVMPRAAVIENVPELARLGRRDALDAFERGVQALGYTIHERTLNAADYGVPQSRRRVFVVLTRDASFRFPAPEDCRVTVRHAIGRTATRDLKGTRVLTPEMDSYITRYEIASKCRTPRDLRPDSPARTLTVRNLSGATGDMIRVLLPDGRRRTISLREAARLQSFPDWYVFAGSRAKQFEQVGNAVPPLLSLALAGAVLDTLERRAPRATH